MFGGLTTLIQSSAQIGPPPTDVPPPTPIKLPQCNPSLSQDTDPAVKRLLPHDGLSESSLVRLLQTIHRPNDLNELHFAALGVHVHANAPAEDLLPDPSYFPVVAGWDGLTIDQARERDSSFRLPLSNGNTSPEARIYAERRTELSVPNQAAFRTVRRLRPEPGKPPVRLGNCYEFFKQMELMAGYWDDTSLPPPTEGGDGGQQGGNAPALPLPPGPLSVSPEQTGSGAVSSALESNARSQPPSDGASQTPERVTYRRQPGSDMPPEHRHNLAAAFVKLVAYDFGCNVAPSRVEPRLHLLEPPRGSSSKPGKKLPQQPPPQRASYFPSGCVFVNRIPTTREAARAGIAEGPVAAISTRNTTNFSSSTDALIDLGRELVAALATAQLRARQNKPERRFGEGKWWATTKRWGGGEGGPIGREVETTTTGADSVVGDKDAPVKSESGVLTASEVATGNGKSSSSSSSSSSSAAAIPPSHTTKIGAGALPGGGLGGPGSGIRPIPMRGQPASKKQRKTPTIYDHYRMVRPPASNWDRKARYEAIGRVHGANNHYDDVFIFSSLFHHFSIVRVRVPDRLLEVLDGAPPEIGEEGEGGKDRDGGTGRRSWGKLEVWRTRWFDLFRVEDRLEAMRELWGVMAWLMRRQEDGSLVAGGNGKVEGEGAAKKSSDDDGGKDVVMKDA